MAARALARAATCALATLALAGLTGSVAVGLGWYATWTLATAAGLLGSALVVGATAAALQLVELEGRARPGWRACGWLCAQAWVLALVGLAAALPQFVYASTSVAKGAEAGWSAAVEVARSYPGAGVLFLAAATAPVAWITVARARGLPLLSQIGLSTSLATPCAAVVSAAACALSRWAAPPPPGSGAAELGDAFVTAFLVAFVGVLLLLVGLLSILVPLAFHAADRLLDRLAPGDAGAAPLEANPPQPGAARPDVTI